MGPKSLQSGTSDSVLKKILIVKWQTEILVKGSNV